jgi:two-component system LytT family response regulator
VPIRALIIDDEPLARRGIRRLLKSEPDVEVVGECGDGETAIVAIREQQPDLVFLDVQMPELSGLDVVRAVGPDAMPVTVFITAHDQYAVRAFDADAIDYLLKPFDRERFARALSRARQRIAGKLSVNDVRLALATIERDATRYVGRLTATVGGRVRFINVQDIAWIGADGNYADVHAAGHTYTLRETLASLEAKLDPAEFARIHRSTIVNIRRIREIEPWFNGHHVVILDTGERLRMSRYQREVARRLGL